jgi:rubrerythrin
MDRHYELAFHNLEDELEDGCEYLREAEEADSQGKSYYAEGLRRIAYDEYTHAKFIREYLTKKGVYHENADYAKLEAHWHRLREKLDIE